MTETLIKECDCEKASCSNHNFHSEAGLARLERIRIRSMIGEILPLGDRVLVKPIEGPDKLKSGLLIPDNAKERPSVGTILSVSPPHDENETRSRLQVGQKVIFASYSGTTVKIKEEDFIILKFQEVLAVME